MSASCWVRRNLRRRRETGAGSRAARHTLRRRRPHRHRERVQPRAPERRVAGRRSEPAAAPPVAVQRHHRADHCSPRRALLQGKHQRPFHGRRQAAGAFRPYPHRRRRLDQADGNRPNRRLGLYALGYEVLSPDGRPAPGAEGTADWLVFNRLAVQPDAARLVYAPGSGIPFYGGRRTRFLYVVTNTFINGVAGEGFWDTTSLAPGRVHRPSARARHKRQRGDSQQGIHRGRRGTVRGHGSIVIGHAGSLAVA